uniref:SPARC related modular calcium binding 1 n=1 Tax=Oryzias sinensis TaxID=183150 RepID=A0A8C8DI88_9TELE
MQKQKKKKKNPQQILKIFICNLESFACNVVASILLHSREYRAGRTCELALVCCRSFRNRPHCLTCFLFLQWLIGDRDGHCGVVCSRTQGKPVCGSDGRSYETGCELQRARCKDKTLTLAHRGRCRGETPTVGPSGSKTGLEAQTRKPQDFIPECNEDGSFVQCHTLTGYCWCATSEGKPVGGSTVRNRTPVCSGKYCTLMFSQLHFGCRSSR